MNIDMEGIEVWVVDHQEHWRRQQIQELMKAGLRVRDFSAYDALLAATEGASPDLILLGCVCCCEEEEILLDQVVQRGLEMIVVASSLSVSETCSLFLRGAMDVLRRPSEASQLLAAIQANCTSISKQRNLLTA